MQNKTFKNDTLKHMTSPNGWKILERGINKQLTGFHENFTVFKIGNFLEKLLLWKMRVSILPTHFSVSYFRNKYIEYYCYGKCTNGIELTNCFGKSMVIWTSSWYIFNWVFLNMRPFKFWNIIH